MSHSSMPQTSSEWLSKLTHGFHKLTVKFIVKAGIVLLQLDLNIHCGGVGGGAANCRGDVSKSACVRGKWFSSVCFALDASVRFGCGL
eukprot:m.41558 g.41558  ORF g.41558 m.41558 type:complete len:88 (+) comp10437_c0_seq1:184-447(+)